MKDIMCLPCSKGVNSNPPIRVSSFLLDAGLRNCPSARVVSNYRCGKQMRHSNIHDKPSKKTYIVIPLESNGFDDCVSYLFDADFFIFSH